MYKSFTPGLWETEIVKKKQAMICTAAHSLTYLIPGKNLVLLEISSILLYSWKVYLHCK